MIIAFCGFIGSGKDTAANYLVDNYNFEKDSFAKTLKDILAILFNWDRTLLEGNTEESRSWRNQIDKWWSKRLGIENFTPRWAMQNIGTNVFRNCFHDEIWVAILENRLKNSNKNIVISDIRFKNEMQLVKKLGGSIIKVSRGPNPHWYQHAVLANAGDTESLKILEKNQIHPSEWSWINDLIDFEILNNDSIDNLKLNIKNLVLNLPVSTVF